MMCPRFEFISDQILLLTRDKCLSSAVMFCWEECARGRENPRAERGGGAVFGGFGCVLRAFSHSVCFTPISSCILALQL